ncbi:hypothetical protein Bca4012_030755 [Brassica carinata]
MGRDSSVPSHSLRLSRSLLPPTRSLLYLPVYLSLSLCFESVFFLFMGRAGGREQRRQYMVVCRTEINYIHESVYIHWSSDKLHSGNHSFRFCWYVLFLCSLEL